jgi:hypothetical protein
MIWRKNLRYHWIKKGVAYAEEQVEEENVDDE